MTHGKNKKDKFIKNFQLAKKSSQIKRRVKTVLAHRYAGGANEITLCPIPIYRTFKIKRLSR